MESKYDLKFEEMKKYIPFLESMIKRLESTSQASANPRQAQLDKIRSLRDLLLNKKKRMKMENLLKCEQVLVNLYAKVEQRDTLSVVKKAPDPGFSIDPPTPQEKSDLEAVRNKLKHVAKRQEDDQDTLPEILRVDEVEEMHTAGSKEPALFQRRPNKSSVSPTHESPTKIKEERLSPQSSASKRNYTRVLVSPDASMRHWSTSESAEDKPLFSRRSPRRSPRRYSPSYHKKERKKSFKESTVRKSKDLNITLNVPEDSLSTLNTKDIFTRIINCKDGDVDIDTLRELRKQILTELKKTGARDDISDLILKSYNRKKARSRKEEVEEGELSDSESEVIENVYGSLSGNLVLKDQSEVSTSTDRDKARKIQICLVINSDKNKPDSNTNTNAEVINHSDVLELEMYDKESKEVNKTDFNKKKNEQDVVNNDDDENSITIVPDIKKNIEGHNSTDKETDENDATNELLQPPEEGNKIITPKESIKFTANFYKPLTDGSEPVDANKIVVSKEVGTQKETDVKPDNKTVTTVLKVPKDVIEAELEQMEKAVQIPLLNEPSPIPKTQTNSTLSEIDILQALKKEILSESITIPGSEAGTPLLHQPKVNKVASAKEILPKKRISIENYKKKIESSIKFYFDDSDSKDDMIKKPSLKLTEKECERFNIQKKMSFEEDSSDGDNGSEIQTIDLYSDLAPKSPDHDESSNMESTPPVIIPGDPVKTLPVNRNADVDMRTLPIISPKQNNTPTLFDKIAGLSSNDTKSAARTEQIKSQNRPVLLDPRVRRDVSSSQSPSPHTSNPDRTLRPAFSNISPATHAVMTPNARSYEMTPNHQSFEIDQNKKHVYVPSFAINDFRERENSVAKDSKIEPSGERKSRFDDIGDTSSWSSSDVSINTRYTDSFTADKYSKGKRNDRYSLDNRDSFSYKRSECPRTPVPSFGRSDVPVTSTQTFSRSEKPITPLHSFGRAECPTTPSHYFGRSECPPTPNHSIGRSECPPTPRHSFGRSECPPTPTHSFGRSDGPSTPSHPFGSHSFNNYECPLTPSHPFGATECPSTPYYGRNECPPTPNHGFGRTDCPSTPNHPFGRSDFNAQKYNKDPRLNRKPEYESSSHINERDRGYYKDRGYYHASSYKSQKPFSGSDTYKSQDRELDRNSKYRYFGPDQTGRQLSKDQARREQAVSGSLSNDNENDRLFSRERGKYNSDNSGYEEVAMRRGHQRERSIGRGVHPEDIHERSVDRHVRAENIRPSSRGPSIRKNSIELENKSLSVKSQAGRSFMIDTSVNATFQKFLESGKGIQVFEYNFDAKRQRAASVGRSLVQKSCCEQVSKRNTETHNKKDVFRRASSMGRELPDSTADKRSFQEVKADFKTYRHPVKQFSKFDTGKIRNIDTKSKSNSENIARSRREKEYYEKYKEEKRVQSTSKMSYSPKKNSRDPRMRKENNPKYKYEDPRAKKSGIVYSNDNIVKGAILSSGYGVKNYKIPKIKRVIEEKEVEISKKDEPVVKKDVKEKVKGKNVDKRKDEEETEKATENSNDSNKGTPKQNNKDACKDKFYDIPKYKHRETPMGKIKEIHKETDSKSDSETEKHQIQIDDPDEQIGRRSTRLTRRLGVKYTVKNTVAKTKRSKKSIISDSDSETDTVTEKLETNETDLGITKPIPPPQISTSPVKEKIISKQPNAIDIHTNFGLELEMFSDNVVSDPVLDNINALIADLDNDLDASKNESSNNFTNEITLENMLQNISSPQDNLGESRDEFTKVLQDVDELTKTNDNKMHANSLSDENEVNNSTALVNTEISQEQKNTKEFSLKKSTTQSFDKLLAAVKPSEDIDVQNDENEKDEAFNSSSLPLNKPAHEDIVSTTEIERDMTPEKDKSNIDERSMDSCSTPDSTINTDVLDKNKSDDYVADSTNEEVQSETNVTSTESVEIKPNLSSTETASDLELGNLLTMLQDKSKIKKLLSMLGDQSGDNDKIKKKLEKLSEIVSDDEIEEKLEQPEKSKTEVSVLSDDKKSEANQTVDKKAIKETESRLNDVEKTQLNKNDEETQLNKDEDQENDDDQGKDESVEDFAGDESFEPEEADIQVPKTKYKKKMAGKKTKKGKGRYAKKVTSIAEKRVTRATAAVGKNKPKKPPRELQQLHEDIREMFIRDDILSATGIRMCRLAKMVDDKTVTKDEVVLSESEPVVVLEKFKNSADKIRDNPIPEKVRKKPGPKPKPKIFTDSVPETEKPKYRPGPKSKTKNKKELDPYAFEMESVGDTTIERASEGDSDHSSDSEVGSLASLKSIFSSSEVLAEIKKSKTKRKRGRGWQDGVIKPKHKKKKVENKLESTPEPLMVDCNSPTEKQFAVPDLHCFTDKNYCFHKNESFYSCRLCAYSGTDIVHHYVNEHPHVEIPLSRMAPALAKEAIGQCKEINFRAVSKISTESYVCIFCYQEFAYNSSVLETFFWHVVSMHTGEYKHTCCECSNENRCPFSLDIPPPPKESKGQLIGYICKKCNFTQLSLENLKNHVIRRHNDEQTAVYTINLSVMSKKTLTEFLRCKLPEVPVIQSSSSPREIKVRPSEEPSDVAENSARVCEFEAAQCKPANTMGLASIKSKITFEADDNACELTELTSEDRSESKIKIEPDESENTEELLQEEPQSIDTSKINQPAKLDHQPVLPTHQEVQQSYQTSALEDLASRPSSDIVDYPHFKINFTESGAKEYICCINGKDNHFKTTLLISMKKHVQLKHSENWDGYCFICKVIVTPQGAHRYKECFQHYLDKHMDNFPIYQKEALPESAPEEVPDKQVKQIRNPASSKPVINVRPIHELIPTAANDTPKETSFPIIQSVVSLGAESPRANPSNPTVRQEIMPSALSRQYEEVQAKVMLNKHRVVLETMMARDKLIKVYKCAGRFCSFTSDSAEDALLHASTHQRIGGVDALNCSYCDFDAVGNAIDLVMHVFNEHGHCQYSCSYCFYRAATSETVAAHGTRIHGMEHSSVLVLHTTVVATKREEDPETDLMLSRDQAVALFVCNHVENGIVCKIRAYTADKFIEHIQLKHVSATLHHCYMCQYETSSLSDLSQHMKYFHDMRLYHCVWCIHGADNEREILGHMSIAHPTKQPKAYLRIMTHKTDQDGIKHPRVLPLVFLNKRKVLCEDITPNATKENPVREAERSIDLEKLIGLTMMMEPQPELEPAHEHTQHPEDVILEAVEPSVAPVAPVASVVPVAGLQAEVLSKDSKIVASIADPSQTDISDNQPLVQTPEAAVAASSDSSLTITKVPIKAEAAETPKTLPGEVVVLDSDDEDTRQPIIDLSDDDTSTSTKKPETNQRVPLEILSTCPKCQQICKSINGLKKHFYYCYPNKKEGSKCAHCPYMASSRDNIMHHYMHDHCDRNVYQCGVCRVNLVTLAIVKRHLKFVHKEKDFVVTSSVEKGISYYVVNVAKQEKKELPKRKLSATTSSTETLPKRRFWPQEINQLPINSILDHLVYCEICEFSTKVRLNMVRHLQLHAEQQPVAQSAPVNPVPHLETNEMHFDKMVNLASSSLATRAERPAPGAAALATRAERPAHVAAAPATRESLELYPRLVPARQRYTCGAAGCSYTSVDDQMLKRHWDALHSNSNSFRCVHCPAYQTIDKTKPITANRVVQHLKMHDDTLYACSLCHVYHYRRDYMEKHIVDNHADAVLYIVRETSAAAASATAAASAAASSSAAPTMDLKPWQCGFCKFKSMLRPEVVEHCSKLHQSKMQYRCGYCPYRASVLENVNNHLAHSHTDEPEDVIYYYYREGSMPDEEDGTPRWMVQRQKMGTNLPEVKQEEQEEQGGQEPPDQTPAVPAPPVNIDLNLVKKEVGEAAIVPESLESTEDLCKKFGQFCEPNGILYKCPLCNVVTEDTREAMQSHLYEELQYRKWGCGLCNYKAFHKAGLTEHMNTEHFRQYDHIELPIDANKEKWVAGQLDYQAAIIDKHKANLAKQKIAVERVNKPVSLVTPPTPVDVVNKYSVTQLEEAFGKFGSPVNTMYCCPKCSSLFKDEAAMRDHLETELNKIRWGCTNCSEKYQTYHEARFHSKGHDGPSRPKEAIRDPSMRAAWVTNIIQAQKKILQSVSVTPTTSEPSTPEKSFTENDDNSLLVVRYEERVPTPDQISTSRKRSAPESDDERLVIDELANSKKRTLRSCPHCPYFSKYYNPWKEHVLRHHNLKPYSCCHCDYNCSYRQSIIAHNEKYHPSTPLQIRMTAIPPGRSYIISPKKKFSAEEEANTSVPKLICLFCEMSLPEADIENHLHENIRPDFAKKGDVVVKCCICLVLRLDVKSLQDHHNLAHPHAPINYAWFKLHHDTRETHFCGYCEDIGFKFIRDLKSHHNAVHPMLLFKYTTVPYVSADEYRESKRKEVPPPPLKRCARKSTTKLPVMSVAKKSTTKLPNSVPSTSDEGYSYYKTKPEPLDKYANVTTLMSFCNRMMPFTLKKLSEIINIEPRVMIEPNKVYRAGTSSDI